MVDNVHARASRSHPEEHNRELGGIRLEAAAHIHDTTEGYDSRYWSEMVLPIWRSIVKTVFN